MHTACCSCLSQLVAACCSLLQLPCCHTQDVMHTACCSCLSQFVAAPLLSHILCIHAARYFLLFSLEVNTICNETQCEMRETCMSLSHIDRRHDSCVMNDTCISNTKHMNEPHASKAQNCYVLKPKHMTAICHKETHDWNTRVVNVIQKHHLRPLLQNLNPKP